MSLSVSPNGIPGSDQRIPWRLTTVTLTFSVGVSVNVNVDPSTLNSAGNVTSPSGLSGAITCISSPFLIGCT
jgi:hypothetical protein